MSEELKYKLFSPTDCLSEQTMYDYIDHRLSPKAQHIVEKHLLECELCSDALEGLRLVKDRNITAEINSAVSERMALPPVVKKEQRFSYRTLIAVAAVLLLLIGGVSLFNHFSSSGRMDSSGMADLKQKNPGQEAPPPPQESQVFDSATTGNAVSATDETGAKPEQKADIHTSTPETTVSSSNGYAETDKFESTPSAE